MPTPVSTARQCLTEEAVRALDDAVAVARRRSHAQTTSLHAVSGLLTMPSSILREVCISRAAHSTPYSSRLQFRALELCVGVSLDRLPSSKSPTTASEDEEPPVSNSLMAAIKRSQATQRRHPETYHLHQIHGSNQTTSVLKVELKYFILSILDDPIVSRVFGEAGFRSTDIKLDVLHPPVTQFSSRFPRSRCPPLFLCNLPESNSGRARFGLPFGVSGGDFDENCRRIGEVLGRKEKKNPLLVGICGGEALKTFTDSINRGKLGFLPLEISGLSVVSVEKEISEMKLDELGRIVEQNCSKSKSGLVLNLGDFKILTSEEFSGNALVSKLSDLLKLHREKLWFIGSVSSNETYLKLMEKFPTIDKDWNLHLLPITSSSQGVYPKSSLMGSFVPFGGFFSSASDFRVPYSNSMNQTLPRCHLCNEKYEQEVTSFGKSGSSPDDQSSETLPSWLQDKGILKKAKDDPNASDSRVQALQKKWDDICQRIHQTPAFPKLSFQPVRPQFPLQLVSSSHGMVTQAQSPPQQLSKPKQQTEEDLTSLATNSPLSCVTTDLGLGTIYGVIKEKPLLATASRHCKDFKSLRELLSRKVGFQNEAVDAISQIICGYRDDESRRRRSHVASNGTATSSSSVWLTLLGPDRVGKKKVASALADIFCGGQENCICVDFKAQFSLDDRFRGKTVVDYIAGEVAKRADSVVFIENVEKAEFPDQIRLSDAVRTGKLRDSHGREISMKNVIVVATTSGTDKDSDCHAPVMYSEERVLNAKSLKLQIKLADDNASNVNKNGVNKRRPEESETEVTELRALKSQRSFLDLNLPVDETEANADEANVMSENTEAWLEDFVELVDGKVTFKVIDFDGLAKNVKRNILSQFHRCFGAETHLEIENDATLLILAALRWSSDEERAFDQWLQTVLASSFVEARQKYYSLTSSSFSVKLVASRDSTAEEETTGIQFPERVEVI
ncbi:unnamed protein product [Microthlaspi erraticum]|uniref:Clp R domain-containing protein n=1 Tax=Microthlaspi erraticum TaxID=1685480 RepID=A0A6D2JP90_9BRAS|nr:unnamed protein product [Microthlaspi erraticum]